ncbi:MAG: hypothetical protein K8F56_20335 [Rhodocyclaceae bacterium]|nr:hypothetical protein [Rhodocyclaceae bacterium]
MLQESGYAVLRFLAEDIGKELDSVLDAILRSISKLRQPRHGPESSEERRSQSAGDRATVESFTASWAPAGTAYGDRRQGRRHAACLRAATSRSQETRVFESPGVFELGVSCSTISDLLLL